MIPIVAATQKYHWGKLGTSSFAGKYSRKTYPNTDEELFQHIHFAEIWMGTHPKAPSSAVISENIQQWLTPAFYEANKGKTVSLTSVIDANRETFLSKSDIFLTEDITTGHLPYLFKVLWLETPLSIQAHPDKTLAEKLHADFSNLYLDDNHKPEMVVALTEFEALWSFSDGASIHRRISSVPSVAKFFDSVNIDDLLDESKFKDTLRFLLKTAYDTPEEVLIECISGMVSEIEAINPEDRARHQRLALQLQKHYSCDVGVIVSFFLNYFELKCGECIVVDVNEPHAWLKGECIELVAASDNVVRGGLTPKYKDIGTFLDMLGYETKSYIPYMGERNDLGFATHVVYNSGHKEFKLYRYYFHESEEVNDENIITFNEDDSAILFVSKGKGKIVDNNNSAEYEVGFLDSFYCLPGRSFNLRKATNEDFEVYIATISD